MLKRSLSTLGVLVLVTALPALGSGRAAAQGPASRLGDPQTGRPSDVAPPEAPRHARVATDPAEVPPPPGAAREPDGYAPGPYGGYAEEDDTSDGGPPRLDLDNRLRALDVTWATLGSQGGPDIANAILSILGGGIEIALGALFLELDPSVGEVMAPFFITLGATTVVRTIVVEFILRPDPRGPALEYQHMPNGTRAQRLRRLEYGEQQLAALSERSLIMRVVDGSLSIAAALAVVPAYLLARGSAFQPMEAFIFVGPAISLVTGIITLASPTAAEQRWAAYQQMRRRMDEARERGEEADLVAPPPAGVELGYGLAFDPNGGGMATITGTF